MPSAAWHRLRTTGATRSAEHNVAIIGYGLAGRFFHGPLVAATRGLRVAAIITSDPVRRQQARADHPGAELLTDVEDLWRRSDRFDVVVIATANDVHALLATQALDHGLAVVVDKPLAVSSLQAQELVAHAQQLGGMLTVFQNRRWDFDQLTLARLLADGRLGTVLRYESRFERWRPEPGPGSWRESSLPEQGGGVLLDLGAHLVDQAVGHFGPVDLVYAEISHRRGTPGDDDAFMALTHRSGVISHLHASALAAAPGPRLRVLGSQAALIVDALDSQEDRLRAGERPDSSADWGVEPSRARVRLVTGPKSVPLTPERGSWQAFYAGLKAALDGDGPLPVDARDAIRNLQLIEAARLSAVEHRVVELV
ncbi:MAG: Gfo/Idh/MocA family protein [Solirubrobacteraceae bacterium]